MDFVDVGNIYKIGYHLGKYYLTIFTIHGGKEFPVQRGLDANLNDILAFPNVLESINENVSLCYRKNPKTNIVRTYLEEIVFVDGKLKKIETYSSKGETLNEALLSLEETLQAKKLGRKK